MNPDKPADGGKVANKVREWFINPIAGYRCEINENGIGLTVNEVHVVEAKAYLAEVEKVRVLTEELESALREQENEQGCDPCNNNKMIFDDLREALEKISGDPQTPT